MARKGTIFLQNIMLQMRGEIHTFHRPLIMGILNLTPDSFYDGGSNNSIQKIIKHVEKMKNEGADIIDIGAYSSRPGASNIDEQEELKRLMSPLKQIRSHFPDVFLSVDTFRSNVAEQAINNGADMINDISSGELDNKMFDCISKLKVPYIMMHMQGNPKNMQQNPNYDDVTASLIKFFSSKIKLARSKGINDIIIDPGFGFGKNLSHNYELLKNLETFKIFEKPMLIGLSRKSMINKVLEISPDNALNGSTVLHTIALLNGANILRVHDVKAAGEAVKIVSYYQNN